MSWNELTPFGIEIKKCLKALSSEKGKRISLKTLANEFGVSPSFLSLMCRDGALKKHIPLEFIVKLLCYLRSQGVEKETLVDIEVAIYKTNGYIPIKEASHNALYALGFEKQFEKDWNELSKIYEKI